MNATSSLPPVPPEVVSSTVDALPPRLRARLDATAAQARQWPVTAADGHVRVAAGTDATVTLTLPVRSPADVSCTCLLAPRCLHRAATLVAASKGTLLTASVEQGHLAHAGVAGGAGAAGGAGDGVVSAAEAGAAGTLWRAAGAVLRSGIPAAGAVTRAALLHGAHEARAVGLHRAAASAIRVAEHLRAANEEDPSFRLGELVAALRDLLTVAHALREPGRIVHRGLRGTARREYREVAGARLYGLCVEPIVTASGYGGVSTLLVSEAGEVWQVSDVMPGAAQSDDRLASVADIARLKARTPVTIGEVRLSHRDLARAGLLATRLRASADGRISSGRGVEAVRADGAGWFDPPLAGLWRQPWAEQIDRYHDCLDRPASERPAGAGLLYLDATIEGTAPGGVVVDGPGGPLLAVAAHDSPRLTYVDNLRLLGAFAIGARVRLLARPAGRRRVAPIGLAATWLPPSYRGHVELGLEPLHRAHLPSPEGGEPATRVGWRLADESLPLHPLRRRVERAVEGGRSAIAGDAAELSRLATTLPHAAELARRLEAASRTARDWLGRVTATGDEELTRAWLAAATYVHAALRSAERDDWVRPSGHDGMPDVGGTGRAG